MDIEVELRPQSIEEVTVLGTFRVPVRQSQVFANGKCVGYIGDADGAPLNFCEHLPEAIQNHIRDQVATLRGSVGTSAGGSIPDPNTVAELIAAANPQFDYDDEGEGDEDTEVE